MAQRSRRSGPILAKFNSVPCDPQRKHPGRIPPRGDPGTEGHLIDPARAEVTRILEAVAHGKGQAARDLLPLVYDELRKLAAHGLAGEAAGQTLQATALVHEAYLRLVGPGPDRSWEHRGQFFAAAAEAMRRILVDRARDRRRQKRGGARKRVRIDLDSLFDAAPDDNLLATRRGPGEAGR